MNAVYLSQEIASLASEGEMKTFTERYAVLQDILKFWKLGKNIKASCSGDDLAEGDSKNLTIEGECQEKESEIKETDTNQNILEEGASKSNTIDQGIQHKKQNPVEEIESEMKKHEETELSKIKIPPRMFKKGKLKGAELTVIGLPPSKKSKRNNIKPSITPFIKLKGIEKDRIILECVVSQSVARNALKSVLLIGAEETKINIKEISDLIRDDNYVHFNRIEKYFKEKSVKSG